MESHTVELESCMEARIELSSLISDSPQLVSSIGYGMKLLVVPQEIIEIHLCSAET